MTRHRLSDKTHRNDAAYLRAKQENYAARAVYKLEEIDQKFRILRQGARVLDLGCWPGSWIQYAGDRVTDSGYVLGIDLKPVVLSFPAHVEHRVADVFEWTPDPALAPFDVVLSDMAPHTTGDRHTDVVRSEGLAERALDIACMVLRPGGHCVVKVFQGGGFGELLKRFRSSFQEARPYHAKNSRTTSTEQYLVGRGLRSNAIVPRP
ncbi:RlmE family RNA methyltransferase [Nannocystis bainbridge]|uniref:Ribosomal RNA large subunit methyltransferase E n=1 Tax=Nannocystis bainbridge TaxID=2995303 RepID=A0ABT5EA55_9BACT|nr:RlmE family RNA methyltransferase [Nannocystis bainbridge]MDC0722729.1 RlmE family RNA methyltransferase [Nannocystis bainbridge]